MNSKLLEMAVSTPGGTSEEELITLAELASEVVSPNIIVEIGTMHGRSALALAAGCYDPKKVFSIEYNQRKPFPPYGIFNFIQGDSSNVARSLAVNRKQPADRVPDGFEHTGIYDNNDVGLLFVDDDHIEGKTSETIRLWVPFMAKKSIFVIHDYHMKETVTSLRDLPSEFVFEKQIGVLAVFRRT